MSDGESTARQPLRFHWWALVLYGACFSAMWVGYTVYSPNGPDPEYWSPDELMYIYRYTAVAGFFNGASVYGITLLMQRLRFRDRGSTVPDRSVPDPARG